MKHGICPLHFFLGGVPYSLERIEEPYETQRNNNGHDSGF